MQRGIRIIYCLLVVGISFSTYSENCSIRGKVIDSDNIPVKNAEVYCEQNLLGPLVRTYTDGNGEFEFQNLIEGPTGIFATTEGMAWSGIHINLPAEENILSLEIVLVPSKTIRGRVVLNEKGKEIGVFGAEVDRFAIIGVEKVAIPCSKLTAFGYKKVVSDREGFFILEKVPLGQSISVKVVHPEYSVTTVEDVSPEQDVKITMSKGCLVLGSVYTIQNDNRVKVANSDVTIKNTQPPYESVCIRTNSNGEFTIRLNPGIYLCKAEASQLQSAGWEVKQVANSMGEHIQIQVFPSVYISGSIMDAISGKPVSGAKVSIEQGGRKALSLITGTKGKFRGKVVHGQAYIKFEAIPGYSIPQPSQLRVVVSGKDEIILPGVWVKKVESLRVKLNVPQQNALRIRRGIISILDPLQLGWHSGDINNVFEINITSLPEKGKIIGYAEIPEENKGNILIIDNKNMGKIEEVNLFTLATVKGKVMNKVGKSIPGVIISCNLKEPSTNQEYLLWQVLSSEDGTFFWNSVVPLKKLFFKIHTEEGSLLWQSSELEFSEGEHKDLSNIIVDDTILNIQKEKEILIRSNYKNLCGEDDNTNKLLNGPSILIFVDKVEVPLMQEVLMNIREILGGNVQIGMITDKEVDCNDVRIPVILGQRVSIATTYLIDENGEVICETFGLPIINRMIRK